MIDIIVFIVWALALAAYFGMEYLFKYDYGSFQIIVNYIIFKKLPDDTTND